jgi:hypothetical protein
MADDIENAIRQSVQGPESAEADGVKVKQYPLPDQIAADKYLAGKEAVSRGPAKGFTRVKIVPPGTVSLMRLWPWTKRKKVEAVGQLMLVRARFDAAQTTPDNRKHWSNADPLSADAAAAPDVRRTLRNRSRYEVANNSYARGIVLTLANDVIGTGPRLQMLADSTKANRTIEAEFGPCRCLTAVGLCGYYLSRPSLVVRGGYRPWPKGGAHGQAGRHKNQRN